MITSRSGALRFVLISVGVLLVYAIGIFARQRCGIRIDIHNESADTLMQVGAKVAGDANRGKKYHLRDIPASAHTSVYVQPFTESSIILEFTDARGIVHAETIVGYAEAGYCGAAIATISSEKKVESISKLGCWKSWLDFI